MPWHTHSTVLPLRALHLTAVHPCALPWITRVKVIRMLALPVGMQSGMKHICRELGVECIPHRICRAL